MSEGVGPRQPRGCAAAPPTGAVRPAVLPAMALAAVLLAMAVPGAGRPDAAVAAGDPPGVRPPVSTRTVVAIVGLDRDTAHLVSFTVKDRPFAARPPAATLRPADEGDAAQVEIVLRDAGGVRLVLRPEIRGLCLEHGPDAPPHVEGDTIRLHHETILIDLPELAGADRVEIARGQRAGGKVERVLLGSDRLTAARFSTAGEAARYADLAFARGRETTSESS